MTLNFKLAGQVRHTGDYIEHELVADNMTDAIEIFGLWLNSKQLHLDALCELDISEQSINTVANT